MNVLTFLAKNWDSVLVIVAFLAVVVVLIKRGETKILKQILFNLVTQAEKQFGSGTGSLKYAAVADSPLSLLPPTEPGSDCIASITANTATTPERAA